MPRLIYTAPFQLTNPVTKHGFIKAKQALTMFSDVSEWVDETILPDNAKLVVTAHLINQRHGRIKLQSKVRLNALQLKQISQIIANHLDQLNLFLMTETPTVNHQNYTAVQWTANQQFQLQNITQPLN